MGSAFSLKDSIYIIKGGNFDGMLLTFKAWKQAKLEMGTGDYNTHTTHVVNVISKKDVWDYCPVSGEFFSLELLDEK